MDLNELKDLLQLLDDKQVAEFELEEEGMKLRIRKGASTPASSPAEPPVPPPSPVVSSQPPPPAVANTAAPAPVAAEGDAGLTVVKSPIVGTFYRASDPNSPPFVQLGDRVRVGQVLCIIEAMKLMNEIEAEAAGEIVRIHHENGQPVQYGEPLFSLRP